MNFSFMNLFQNYSLNSSMNQPEITTPINSQMANQIRNVAIGQNISGQVVGINQNDVQIDIGEDIIITARFDKGMNILMGQTLMFEVNKATDSHVVLRPLFANTVNDANIIKALEVAKLPVNETTISMVSNMMEQGMSIDKQALQGMLRDITIFMPDNPASAVAMKQLQIPFTQENVTQFVNYQQSSHQLLGGLQEIMNELPSFINELGSQQEQKAINFYNNLVNQLLLSGEEKSALNLLSQPNMMLEHSSNKIIITDEIFGKQQEINAKPQNLMLKMEEMTLKSGEGIIKQEELSQKSEEIIQKTDANMQTPNEDSPILLKDSINLRDCREIAYQLKELNVDPNIINFIRNGTYPMNDFVMLLGKLCNQKGMELNSKLRELLTSKQCNKVLSDAFTKQLLISPKNIMKDGAIEELYRKILEQTSKLEQIIQETGKGESSLMKAVMNVQQNVDFMNQLNQSFQYVQLPLKMSNKNANGELYVYTNKKNLASKDGNVSALLHLDMDNLGSMDIFVAMEQKKVSTKFYLQKEETIDFIYKNIHLLNKRLEQKGYLATSEMILKEKPTKMIEEILEENGKRSEKPTLLSKFAFDVRA